MDWSWRGGGGTGDGETSREAAGRNYERRQAQWEEMCTGGRYEGEDKHSPEGGEPPGLGLGRLGK